MGGCSFFIIIIVFRGYVNAWLPICPHLVASWSHKKSMMPGMHMREYRVRQHCIWLSIMIIYFLSDRVQGAPPPFLKGGGAYEYIRGFDFVDSFRNVSRCTACLFR